MEVRTKSFSLWEKVAEGRMRVKRIVALPSALLCKLRSSTVKHLSTADIDALCDRFESQCKAGEAPRIEDFLRGLSADDREQMLRELLYIDHQHRQRSGSGGESDYYQRFQDHTYIVDEVLNHGVGHNCDTQLQTVDSSARQHPDDSVEDAAYESLLEALPAGETASGDAPAAILGDYELLDELGRGGMGIVYRARQKSVGRIVALKILRRDKLRELHEEDQAAMIERFRNESQSAAQLEHDHIVQVFEVGQANGLHYYSMRYVQGESLADVIAEHPLDNNAAAEAIEPVARALAAAHAAGVLHRDIKPRNIVIDDTTGRPLLTDFGLAKMLAGQSDVTHTGDVMGSPPYMSPEQATDAAHVTASADIYSLGATLYHALTGRAPFQAASVAETLRQVWFEDPPLPRSLNPAIDQDLETICLKCLEKEPARRFETAGEMAEELARYRRGEPIHSRPLSTLGQFQRWRRRNPTVAKLLGLVALLIILGFAGVTYYTIQLQRSLNDARVRLGWAVGAVDEMTDIATRDDGLKAHGVDEVRREMLTASRQYYDRFVERETNDPVLETERGKAYGRLANIEADLGDRAVAARLYSQAIDVFTELEQRFPNEPNYTYLRAAYLANLGGLLRDGAQLDDAEDKLTEAYTLASGLHEKHPGHVDYVALLGRIHNERGVLYMDLGETEKAEFARRETVNLWQQITDVDNGPEQQHQLATSHNNLAEFYRNDRQREKAAEHYTTAIDLWQKLTESHPRISEYGAGLAMCQHNFATMHLDAGDGTEAEPLLMASIAQRYHLSEKHRQLPEYRADLAASLDSMGRLMQLQGEYQMAASEYRQALAIREELRNRFADTPKYEVAYAASQMHLGDLYQDEGRFSEAGDYFRIALDVLGGVVENNPGVVTYREHFARVTYNLALVQSAAGELEEAKKHVTDAAGLRHALLAEDEDDRQRLAALAECYDLLREIEEQRGDAPAALAACEQLIELQKELANESTDSQHAIPLAASFLSLANIQAATGDFTAAAAALTSAIATIGTNADSANNPQAGQLLLVATTARAEIHDELGKHELAVKDWDEVLKLQANPLYELRRAVSIARGGDHASAAQVVAEMKTLHVDDANTGLLLNAACVLSRAAEAAEGDQDLQEGMRKETAQQYLADATAFIHRSLAAEESMRDEFIARLTHDPDLSRWQKTEAAQMLLGEDQ